MIDKRVRRKRTDMLSMETEVGDIDQEALQEVASLGFTAEEFAEGMAEWSRYMRDQGVDLGGGQDGGKHDGREVTR